MNYSENKKENLFVSIGLPVYNGEHFLEKRLTSLLSQTYSNFELIISDNASNDSTEKICREFCKKDKRIEYIRHNENRGATWNYHFVLHKARFDFFVWAAVDDIWDSTFLEKNMKALSENKNLVNCVSKTQFYKEDLENVELNKIDEWFRNFIKKLKYSVRQTDNISLSGKYEKKVRLCLKKLKMHPIYGIFRTAPLQKGYVNESFVGNDLPTLLNVLRYGDFHVIDKNLMSIYESGHSKKGIISLSKQFNKGTSGIIFPMYPLTKWCFKNLGKSIFFKNIDYFIQLNLWGGFSLVLDLFRHFLNMLYKK